MIYFMFLSFEKYIFSNVNLSLTRMLICLYRLDDNYDLLHVIWFKTNDLIDDNFDLLDVIKF